jgi:hypothetical protein
MMKNAIPIAADPKTKIDRNPKMSIQAPVNGGLMIEASWLKK